MRISLMIGLFSLGALLAGCGQKPTNPPTPKTDAQPQPGAVQPPGDAPQESQERPVRRP